MDFTTVHAGRQILLQLWPTHSICAIQFCVAVQKGLDSANPHRIEIVGITKTPETLSPAFCHLEKLEQAFCQPANCQRQVGAENIGIFSI